MKIKFLEKLNNRQRFRLLSVGIALIGLLLIGAFSLAYLAGKDEVSNFVKSKYVEINLYEPAWYNSGEEMAKKQVPGMIIDKDPYAVNVGEEPVYIRMKIEIVQDGKVLKNTDNLYKKIMAIICIDQTEDKGDPTVISTSISRLWNSNFSASLNPNFVYKNGWFYYVDASDAAKPYKILYTNESTERLFYELHYPVLKKDYNSIFEKPFTINVIAQGVPVENVKDTSKIESVFDKFAKNVTSGK